MNVNCNDCGLEFEYEYRISICDKCLERKKRNQHQIGSIKEDEKPLYSEEELKVLHSDKQARKYTEIDRICRD